MLQRFARSGWSTVLCLGTLVLAALDTPAHADVIYSNFNPGDLFYSQGGLAIESAGALGGIEQVPAAWFVSSANFSVTQLDLALSTEFGNNLVNVALETDSGGGFPSGIVLASTTLTGLPSVFNATTLLTNDFTTWTLSSGVNITAGERYWVVCAASGDTSALWNASPVGDPHGAALEPMIFSGWRSTLAGTYRVIGNLSVTAPEPASLAFLGMVALPIVGMIRRRRV
jgi:hypothetical protein